MGKKQQQLLPLQLMLLLLLLSCVVSGSSPRSAFAAKLVTLQLGKNVDVGEERGAATAEAAAADVDLERSFRLELHHREAQGSPLRTQNATRKQLMLWKLRRDVIRSRAISNRIKLAYSNVSLSSLNHPDAAEAAAARSSSSVASFESPLISGVAGGSGDYFVRIGVGTPARDVYMVADTGSDVSWLQCSPCRKCYRQQGPIFDPALSSSFKELACESSICGRLKVKGCSSRNKCLYQVSYGDGSFTVGDFSTETLTFGNHTVNSVPMGCGRNNQGLFHGAAGLLGLGRGPLSFPSESGESFGHAYSYCLPRRDSRASASLIFGPGSVPASAKFTNLVPNARLTTYYYVNMAGIRVGGTPIKLPTDVFVLSSRGDGGVIVDSGTAITRLTTSAYNVLRDAFRGGLRNSLPPAAGISLFDTCFDLSSMSTVKMPAVDLVFEGGATMELPADNILVQVDDQGTFCFAFAPEDEAFSIIGNVQQQTFRISIDNAKNQMGVAFAQC